LGWAGLRGVASATNSHCSQSARQDTAQSWRFGDEAPDHGWAGFTPTSATAGAATEQERADYGPVPEHGTQPQTRVQRKFVLKMKYRGGYYWDSAQPYGVVWHSPTPRHRRMWPNIRTSRRTSAQNFLNSRTKLVEFMQWVHGEHVVAFWCSAFCSSLSMPNEPVPKSWSRLRWLG
jgi:hypothetical protein